VPNDPILENADATAEEAASVLESQRKGVRSRDREFAPELIVAAEAAEALAQKELASGDEEAAKAAFARAERHYVNARAVADRVTRDRTLRFTRDRATAVVELSPWGTAKWAELGDTTGSYDIPSEHMVHVSALPEFGRADVRMLIELGPGAIQSLSLTGVKQLDDELLSLLPEIVGLRDLNLYDTEITDEQMAIIGRMPALRHLNLMSTPVTDAGLLHDIEFPALEELFIAETKVTDRGMLVIRSLPRLRTLVARGLNLSDVGIDYLRTSPALEVLWVSGLGVTDFGLPLYTEFPNLKELVLLQTVVTHDGVERLEIEMPDCDIDLVGG